MLPVGVVDVVISCHGSFLVLTRCCLYKGRVCQACVVLVGSGPLPRFVTSGPSGTRSIQAMLDTEEMDYKMNDSP